MADTPRKVVYVGWCKLEGGKPGALLKLLQDDNSLGRELVFARKAMAHSIIGGVYTVEQTAENSFRLAARTYDGKYYDSTKVAEWQLENRAEQLREEAARAEKNDKDVPEALALLQPLRAIHRKALPDRKRAIELLLLDYLRR
jgi:hypothetical protein